MKKELQKASDLIDEIYQNIKNIKSIDLYRTLGSRYIPGNHIHRRRLAGAVRPKKPVDLSRFNMQR